MNIRKLHYFLVLFVLASISVSTAWAQSGNRYALVIGNAEYTNFGTLRNPVNDANAMEETLIALGFTVDIVRNGSLDQMENAAVRLKNRLSDAGNNAVGFFYYAGHGVEVDGVNYLIPADANIPDRSFLRNRALSAQVMLDLLNESRNALNIVVLDACRDFPATWSRSLNRGLAVVSNPPANSIIMYATAAGQTAQDGTGDNGVFTTYLLNNLSQPYEIKDVFNRTMGDVRRATDDLQRPFIYTDFAETLYLTDEAINIVYDNNIVIPAERTQSGQTAPSLPMNNGTGIGTIGYGLMNIAFGLGSYMQGDVAGGIVITGGFAASLGLIAWELSLSKGDVGYGIVGPVGAVLAVGTAIFGFVKPNLYVKNQQLTSILDRVNIATVSSEQNKFSLSIGYTHSF